MYIQPSHPARVVAALCFLSFTQAGQLPFGVDLQAGVCSIAERDSLLKLSHDLREQHYGSCHQPHLIPKTPPPSLWTEEVKCTPTENTTETYCIYTSDKFANGRGISFFTTPSIAQRVASLPAFTQEGIYDNVNSFDDPPWEIKYIPGRGKGLFATRTLHRGDPIIAGTPLGVYNSDAFPHDFPLGYIYLHTAFIQLPKPSQELFLQTLAHSKGDPIMERINTNAFAGDFEGSPHFLMYPETARMNHDCRPNAMYYYDPGTLIHASQASRTIHPGEEITIPYINILQSRAERQTVLSNYWGFTCTCSLCSSDKTHMDASDARIKRIVDLQNALADWTPGSRGSPSTAEMLLSLYEEEHIHAGMGTGHIFAALAYNAVGETEMARRHAQLALEAGMVNSGSPNGSGADDVGDEGQMRSLIQWPEGHWSFMARRR